MQIKHSLTGVIPDTAMWIAAKGAAIHTPTAIVKPSTRLIPIMLRTVSTAERVPPLLRRRATRWMLASQKPEAMMPPALTMAVAIIHRPYSEAPSL